MAPPPLSIPRRRPNTWKILAIFAILAILGLWFLRIAPILYGTPIGLLDAARTGLLPNGVSIKKQFSGIEALDKGVSILVIAFLYGPAQWNPSFYWLQVHFLIQFGAIIAVMNVEACRDRHRMSWLRYTAVYAFIYQNIGACIVIPIWWILFHRISADKSYFARGRSVPLPYAWILLPAMLVLYALPTAAMLLFKHDLITLQNIVAFWQLTPILVNIPLWFASPFVSSAPAPKAPVMRTADRFHLKVLYGVFLLVCAAVHWYTIFGISVSKDPTVTYASVWVPRNDGWRVDLSSGLLFIFQWDWIVTGLACIIAAFVAVQDVQRLIYGSVSGGEAVMAGAVVVSLALLAGPGAALTAVWYWRENKLALIQQRLSAPGSNKSI